MTDELKEILLSNIDLYRRRRYKNMGIKRGEDLLVDGMQDLMSQALLLAYETVGATKYRDERAEDLAYDIHTLIVQAQALFMEFY